MSAVDRLSGTQTLTGGSSSFGRRRRLLGDRETSQPVVDREARLERWFFAAALALYALPVLLLQHFPTQDGPAHGAMANVLRQLDGSDAGRMRLYFEHNPRMLFANQFVFFLWSVVLKSVPLALAVRLTLAFYVVAFPLAARYALRSLDPRAGPLAWLAFPFVYNYLFEMGFYNFCFGLVGFFLIIGCWQRVDSPSSPRLVTLAALALLTYFCHPLALVMAALAVGFLAGWRTWLELRNREAEPTGWKEIEQAVHRNFVPLTLAFLPTIGLLLGFVGPRLALPAYHMPIGVALGQLFLLYSLVSTDVATVALSAALSLTIAVFALRPLLARWRQRSLDERDGFLLLALVDVVVYFLAPDAIVGGGYVNHRLQLFPFFAILLWLGQHMEDLPTPVAIARWSGSIALGLLGILAPHWRELDELTRDGLTVAREIAPHSTVLTLSFTPQGREPDGDLPDYRVLPFLHVGSLLAEDRQLIDLSLYSAHEDYFPIAYRASMDPYTQLSPQDPSALEDGLRTIDFAGYERRTGGCIDYLLLWQLSPEQRRDPAMRGLIERVDRQFERVARSPAGNAELYRRRPPPAIATCAEDPVRLTAAN